MIRVSEIFGPTIQGEGTLIGLPTVFVRIGGCDYRCAWCDTMYAVDPKYRQDWTPMSDAEIVDKVLNLADGPILVTLSGGNPAIQQCAGLIAALQAAGCTVAMETQASLWKPWFPLLDHLVLSPKPPSSGNTTPLTDVKACLDVAPKSVSLKVVVGDADDFEYAMRVHAAFPAVPFIIQPCNFAPGSATQVADSLDAGQMVAEWVVDAKKYTVRVLPQLHLLWWGGQRGV